MYVMLIDVELKAEIVKYYNKCDGNFFRSILNSFMPKILK